MLVGVFANNAKTAEANTNATANNARALKEVKDVLLDHGERLDSHAHVG